MENKKLNKSVTIGDEMLEGVSGGTSVIRKYYCEVCKRAVAMSNFTSYQGRGVCKECKAKLENK